MNALSFVSWLHISSHSSHTLLTQIWTLTTSRVPLRILTRDSSVRQSPSRDRFLQNCVCFFITFFYISFNSFSSSTFPSWRKIFSSAKRLRDAIRRPGGRCRGCVEGHRERCAAPRSWYVVILSILFLLTHFLPAPFYFDTVFGLPPNALEIQFQDSSDALMVSFVVLVPYIVLTFRYPAYVDCTFSDMSVLSDAKHRDYSKCLLFLISLSDLTPRSPDFDCIFFRPPIAIAIRMLSVPGLLLERCGASRARYASSSISFLLSYI